MPVPFRPARTHGGLAELSERSEAKFAVGMRTPSFFDGGFYSQPPANESRLGVLFVGEPAYAPTKDIGTMAGK